MLLKHKNILIYLTAALVCAGNAFADPGQLGSSCESAQKCNIGLYCDRIFDTGYCYRCNNAPFDDEDVLKQKYLSYGTDYSPKNNCSWYIIQESNTQWDQDTQQFSNCDPDTETSPEGLIIYYNGDWNGMDASLIPSYNGANEIPGKLSEKESGTYFFVFDEGNVLSDPISPIPRCVAKPYSVSVNCTGGTATYCGTAGLYRQYDNATGWFYEYDDVATGQGISTNLTIPTKNCAVFNGFYDTNNTMVFSATGVSQTTADNPIITGPGTTITAQWTPAQYTLQINNINNATSNCTCGQNCAIPAYTNCTPGKYVSAITVLDDCGTIADGVFTPSATCQIQDGGQIILTATVDNCPAGYYCTECQKHQCPNGQTSDAGTGREKDCYYGAGTTYTDTYGGSFTLPVKITVVSQN